MSPEELEAIERRLAALPLTDRKALARRLIAEAKPRTRGDEQADHLLAFLRQLRRRTDVLPPNREVEQQAGLEGEDISYLLRILRQRRAIVIDYPFPGSFERTFDLPW